MTHRLLPLLVLLACSGPAEYHRGAPAPPPPAPPMPGIGAPVMGQPGSFREPLPRSPNSRVLPPTKEPGLWSADRPRASSSKAEAAPLLYGIELPAPDEVGPVARFHAAMCARSLEDATQQVGKASLVAGLSRQQKACLALQLQVLCLATVRSQLPPAQREELNAIVDVTGRAETEACIGVAYGKGAMKKAFDAIAPHWSFSPSIQRWWEVQ